MDVYSNGTNYLEYFLKWNNNQLGRDKKVRVLNAMKSNLNKTNNRFISACLPPCLTGANVNM